AEAATHSGPGLIYVVEGTLTIMGAAALPLTYSAGDVFLDPAGREGLIYRNMGSEEPTKVLLYHVSDPQAPAQTPPMMPYAPVHDPVFASASAATFALEDDLVIGVVRGKMAKAYMALDFAEHATVDGQRPER